MGCPTAAHSASLAFSSKTHSLPPDMLTSFFKERLMKKEKEKKTVVSWRAKCSSVTQARKVQAGTVNVEVTVGYT